MLSDDLTASEIIELHKYHNDPSKIINYIN